MSDLITQLDEMASGWLPDCDIETLKAAKAEIERLRGVRSDLMQAVAEIERLRAALREIKREGDKDFIQMRPGWMAKIAKEALGEDA